MEASSLRHAAVTARPAPGPLLRLANDDRLIALTRRGNQAAFEVLVGRYQPRLLAFCRHMLGSREDAEDVLQESFAAAYSAILADTRQINVRPWLYRIARNRSLNHMRRTTPIGVESMDVYLADHGQSVFDRILQRESFHALVEDIGQLAETQRTALLLREMDAFSYEHIAHVMDTTVPSVKSLLVRARVALAEAAEARKLSCEEVRIELGEVSEGLIKISPPARRHVRDCDRCRGFQKQLKQNERTLAALAPFGLPVLLHKLLATKIGSTSAGGAYAATSTSATASASASLAAGATAAGGVSGVGGLAGIGGTAIAAKAVAGIAAAVIVTAVAVGHGPTHVHPVASAAATTAAVHGNWQTVAPAVVASTPQAATVGGELAGGTRARAARRAANTAKHHGGALHALRGAAGTSATAAGTTLGAPNAAAALHTAAATPAPEGPAAITSSVVSAPTPGTAPTTVTASTPSAPAAPAAAETGVEATEQGATGQTPPAGEEGPAAEAPEAPTAPSGGTKAPAAG
jgi:RNA polymerase sigma factor (sigma-70 family)